jgi:hypothetical protein
LWSRGRRLVDDAVGNVRQFGKRLDAGRIASLRRANTIGTTTFAADVDLTTFGGLLRLLPVGVAHTLLAPFPTSLSGSPGTTGRIRSFSFVELPWMYTVAILGWIGLIAALRRTTALTVTVAVWVVAGVVLLSLTVPNDGLLFRYRLPFVAPLVAFVPAGAAALRGSISRFRRVSHSEVVAAGTSTSPE